MEIVFLGTGSAYPTPRRGSTCIILRHTLTGACWMFDCGEGSQIQLMRSVVRPGKISRIFITHLHGDHVFGLPGLLCTISQNFSPDAKSTIELYGPRGLRQFVRTSLRLSESQLGFSYAVHELHVDERMTSLLADWSVVPCSGDAIGDPHPNEIPGRDIHADLSEDGSYVWPVHDEGALKVTSGILRHRVVCFGYRVEERPLPGRLDVAKLRSKGIGPGPLYARVKAGETIATPDGELIRPEDVLGPTQPGITVAVLGDTCCSLTMASLCREVDVLVHEATLENDMKESAVLKGHSTPEMAGKFAGSVGTRHLVLTHFSQRYKTSSFSGGGGSEEVVSENTGDGTSVLVEQTKHAFDSDDVMAADDFTVVSIARNKTEPGGRALVTLHAMAGLAKNSSSNDM